MQGCRTRLRKRGSWALRAVPLAVLFGLWLYLKGWAFGAAVLVAVLGAWWCVAALIDRLLLSAKSERTEPACEAADGGGGSRDAGELGDASWTARLGVLFKGIWRRSLILGIWALAAALAVSAVRGLWGVSWPWG